MQDVISSEPARSASSQTSTFIGGSDSRTGSPNGSSGASTNGAPPREEAAAALKPPHSKHHHRRRQQQAARPVVPPLLPPAPPSGRPGADFGITLPELQHLLSAAADARCALPPLPPALRPPLIPGEDAAFAAAAAAAALSAALRTSLVKGLPEDDPRDREARAAAFGANRLPDAATSSLWQLLVEAASDTTMVMLMAAGAVSIGLSVATRAEAADYIDGAAILASVVICVGFAAGTNYSKESKFRQLNAAKDDVLVRVVRDEREVALSIFDLLVGDVLLVEAGDILPADGLLLTGSGELKVDESQLTGESDDVIKDPVAAPVCFSGSKVLEGFGKLLVLAVGPNSQQGLINAAVIAGKGGSAGTGGGGGGGGADGAAAMRQQTALSSKLEDLAHSIGRVGMGAAAATLAFNCACHTADLAAAGRLAAPWALEPDALQRYLDFVITSITLLVVAVPEGLPLAVTLALAFSVARMLSDNNLVRHLDACETMAGCTTICSDKTGTLTSNNMRVTHLVVDGSVFRVRPSGTTSAEEGGSGGGGSWSSNGEAMMPALAGASSTEGGRGSPWAANGRGGAAGSRGGSGGAILSSSSSISTSSSASGESVLGGSASVSSAGGSALSSCADAGGPQWRLPAAAGAAGRPGSRGASRPGSRSGAGGAPPGPGAPPDALLPLGLDTATYVSLSLDGGDDDVLSELLGQRPPGTDATPEAVQEAAGQLPGLSARVRDLLVANITLNSTASVRYDPGTRTVDRSGNRTECALLEFAYRLKGRREALSAALACKPRVVASLPFTSARKMMAVVIADEEERDPAAAAAAAAAGRGSGRWATAYVKGAAEILLDRCSHRLAADGSEEPLTSADRASLLAGCGRGGLRVLALAHKRLELPAAISDALRAPRSRRPGRGAGLTPAATAALDESAVDSGLVLAGLVGIEDALRAEVPGAIRDCQRAGIMVRMITGDNAGTAAAVARACGILPQGWNEPLGDGAAAAAEAALALALAGDGGGRGRFGGSLSSASCASMASMEGMISTASSMASLDPQLSLALAPGWGGRGAGAGGGSGEWCAPGDPRLAVMEGPAFRALVLRPDGSVDLDAFLALWPHVRVLARCSPGDKHMLVEAVKALRAQGRLNDVVAMTGDGTNDAPALAAADVGFAMAAGTCIARDASDILLLDNNFRSIVSAVKWGRNVYASVTKFLQFQLTANVVAVSIAAGGAVLLRSSPLSAVQMLWVNLIMDSLASLALATESPSDELLDEPPRTASEPLVPPTVVKHVLGQAALQLTLLASLLGPLGAELSGGDGVVQRTMLFNAFVWLQLFNQINCRRVRDSQPNVLEGVTRQPQFAAILAAEAALQFAIVEFGGRAFSVAPLTPLQWGVCIAMGATSLLVRAGLRRVPLERIGSRGGAAGLLGPAGATPAPEARR